MKDFILFLCSIEGDEAGKYFALFFSVAAAMAVKEAIIKNSIYPALLGVSFGFIALRYVYDDVVTSLICSLSFFAIGSGLGLAVKHIPKIKHETAHYIAEYIQAIRNFTKRMTCNHAPDFKNRKNGSGDKETE